MDWSAIVQAGSSLALVAITIRYVRLTHELVHLQIEPQIDLRIDTNLLELKVRNAGASPVRDLEIESDFAVIGKTKEVGARKWKQDFWRLKKLVPGQDETRSIRDVVTEAVDMARTFQNLSHDRGLSDAEGRFRTTLRFNLTYCRQVDRRRYNKAVRVLVVRDLASDAPVLIDPAAFRGLDMDDA